MSSLRQDLRYTSRALRRRPGFAAVAVVTVALGIAANTSIFSVVNRLLLRPLPFQRAGELATLDVVAPTGFYISLSIPNYEDWRERNRSFQTFGASAGWGLTVTGLERAEVVSARLVLGEFFETLGIAPLHGRTIESSETGPGAPPIAVLSHGFWERSFGADPAAVGQTITLDDQPYTIVGILPPASGYPSPATAVYAPMGVMASDLPWDDRDSSFGTRAIARLLPGATFRSAQDDMDRVAREVRESAGVDVATAELRSLSDFFVGPMRTQLWILMGAVGFVLLIACANVASLLLARGEGRRHEIALRTALGAGRGAIVRQLMTEAAILSAAGGALGLGLAFLGIQVLRSLLPSSAPFALAGPVGIDTSVLLFTIGISALTGLLFGLVPAFRASRIDLAGEMKESSRGSTSGQSRQRLRSGLVVAEVALCLVLLIGAGLMSQSLSRLRQAEKGFDSESVFTARVAPARNRVPDRQSWFAFFDDLLTRTQSLPGVRSAALTLLLPLADRSWERLVLPEGVPWVWDDAHSVLYGIASEDYFETMGVPILAGRPFDASDRDGGTLVAVIDETMAERYWPGEDPIGKRIAFEFDEGWTRENPLPIYRTVVGVAKNVRHYELETASRIQVYVPFRQTRGAWGMDLTLIAKTSNPPMSLMGAARAELDAIDRDVPLSQVQTLQDYVDAEMAGDRSMSLLLGIFSAIALLMAGVGLFGVLSFTVAQRTRELGIRMALGAGRMDVVRLLSRQAMRLTAAGVAIGLLAALGLTRLISGFLYEVSPIDPVTYAGVSGFLAAVALFAVLIPARRAVSVDPASVLRYEE